MKRRWLICLSAIIMALSFCLGLVACGGNEEKPSGASDREIAQGVIDTLDTLYGLDDLDTKTLGPLIGKVRGEDKFYDVKWSVSSSDVDNITEYVTISTEVDENGSYPVTIKLSTEKAISYTLTASVTVGEVTLETSYKHRLPQGADRDGQETATSTITFESSENREEQTAETQVWSANGIKVTNNRDNSSNKIVDNINPVRFYANSTVIIEASAMVQLDFHTRNYSDSPYTDYIEASLKAAYPDAMITKDTDNEIVSIDLGEHPMDVIEFVCTKQIRVYSIDVECYTAGLNDAQRVYAAKQSVHLPQTIFFEANTLQLPAKSNGADIAWSIDANDYASVENGALKVTALPAADTTLSLKGAISSGSEKGDTSITLTLKPAPVLTNDGSAEHPFTVEEAAKVSALLASGDYYRKNGEIQTVYIKGYVASGNSYNSTYGNYDSLKLTTDASGALSSDNVTVYGLPKVDSLNTIPAGAELTVKGALQNYRGNTPELTRSPETVSYSDNRSPEDRVDSALAALKDITVMQEGNVTLTASPDSDVTFAWALKAGEQLFEGATFENGVLNVTALPEEETVVTFIVTASMEGTESKTAEVKITFKAAGSVGYGTAEKPLTVAQLIELAGTIDGNGYLGGSDAPQEIYVRGIIIQVDGWDSQYSNWTKVYIADTADAQVSDKTKSAQVYRLALDDTYIKTQDDLLVGGTITIHGWLQKYNGSAEVCHSGDTNCTAVAYEKPAHVHVWESYTYTSGLKHTMVCNVDGCPLNKAPQTEDCECENNVCKYCEHSATQEEILTALKALAKGSSLKGTYSLSGTVTKEDKFKVGDSGDWQFYFMVGETELEVYYASHAPVTADQLHNGDEVTVLGVLKNFNGTLEFNSGSTITAWKAAAEKMPDEKIAAAKTAVEQGKVGVEATYTATNGEGVALPTENNGATLAWAVENAEQHTANVKIENNKLIIVALPEQDLKVNLVATITCEGGTQQTAKFEITIKAQSVTPGPGTDTDEQATLTFDASKSNRISQDANSQVWQQNGITFTNTKGDSTTNVADYGNPVRCYLSSKVKIECTSAFTKLVFHTAPNYDDNPYVERLSTTLSALGIGTVTADVDAKTVTLVLTTAQTSIEFTVGGGGQHRYYSIDVYTGEGGGTTPTPGPGGDEPTPGTPLAAGNYNIVLRDETNNLVWYVTGAINNKGGLTVSHEDTTVAVLTVIYENSKYTLKIGDQYLEAYLNGTYKNMRLVDSPSSDAIEWKWSTEYSTFYAEYTDETRYLGANYYQSQVDNLYDNAVTLSKEMNFTGSNPVVIHYEAASTTPGGGDDPTPGPSGDANFDDVTTEFPTTSIPELTEKVPNENDTTTESFYVLGAVKSFDDSDYYCNFHIYDANGNDLYVYGLYKEDGSEMITMTAAKALFDVDDIIVLYGTLKNYKGTAQIVNAWLVQINKEAKTDEAKVLLAGINLVSPVVEDFDLPTMGGKVTWAVTSGTGIKIENNVAKVTRTESNQEVVLTATATVGTKTATKTFTVVVSLQKEGYEEVVLTAGNLLAGVSGYKNDGTATIGNYGFSWIGMGNYDLLQMRTNTATGTSSFWNTDAFNENISKVVFTWAASKTLPSKTDVLKVEFANDVNFTNATSQTISFTEKTFELTVTGQYKYVRITHNNKGAVYLDEVKIICDASAAAAVQAPAQVAVVPGKQD